MKKIILIILFVPCICFSQKKIFIDLGGQYVTLDQGESGYGGRVSLRLSLNKILKIGVGLDGYGLKKANNIDVPLYIDLRAAINKNIDILIEPGYNYYDYKANYYNTEISVQGGFYIGAGFDIFLPISRKVKIYLQAKYTSLGFITSTTFSQPYNGNVETNSSLNGASFGIGFTF
jgi:hypothetical protein